MKYVGDTIVYPEHAEDGSGYRIPIPTYHRAAVGIFPGTKLFLLPIPKTKDLIVTPIEPNRWGDLWKLDVALKDTPGAARSIVETLVNNKVNILIQEGLSDYAYSGGLAHRVLLVLDLANYTSDFDRDTNYRKTSGKHTLSPNHLITNILSRSVDFLLPTPSEDRWDLQFERMEFFYRNKEHKKRQTEARLISKKITVPLRTLQEHIYGSSTLQPAAVACHIISDTEEKYIKIRFLDLNATYALIRIEHSERIGAILSFMDVLKKKEANISSSYSRVASMSETAVWYALFEIPSGFSRVDTTDLLQGFSRLEDVKSFTLLGHYGFSFDPIKFAADQGVDRYRRDRPGPRAKGSTIAAAEKHKEIEGRLGIRPFYAGKTWGPTHETVFVTIPFDAQYDGFYEGFVRGTIEACGLQSMTDKSRLSILNPSFAESIKQLVATCRFVVADVSGLKPNVLYGLGLAQAIGKRVLLICEDRFKGDVDSLFGISDFQRLYYSPYNPHAFVEQLSNKVRNIKEEGFDVAS